MPPGNFFEIFDAKSSVWGQFWPENKLIEGQPNEYDVICRNASVLAVHLWPTIIAGAPFRLKNICRNGVPPRSRTTRSTRLHIASAVSEMQLRCRAVARSSIKRWKSPPLPFLASHGWISDVLGTFPPKVSEYNPGW